MLNNDATRMVKDFYAHIDAHGGDFSALAQYIDDGLRFHFPGEEKPRDLRGFKTFVDDFYAAFPDLRHELTFQLCEDNRVATRMTVGGTHKAAFMKYPPTHKRVTFTVHSICTLKDGKLTDYYLEGDLLGLMRQVSAT